jgi:hypothetical protein
MRGARANRLLLLANGVSLVALSLIVFRRQAPVTFFRYDGVFILSVVKSQAEWISGFPAYAIDMLKGLGGPGFPIDTRLMPGFIVGRLAGDGDWLPALAATCFALEFAAATLLIGRAIDLPLPVGSLAAWLGLFGSLPYLVPTPALELLWGNPHFLSSIAYTMAALALFLAIGRGSRRHALGCAAGVLVVLVYLTLSTPLSALLFLPVVGFFAVVGLAMARTPYERRCKLMAMVGLVPLYLMPFAAWLAGYFLFAKTTFFWSEMYPSTITWRWASLLLKDPSGRPAGVVFLAVALLGAVQSAFGPVGALRRFAAGYLIFTALLWAFTGFLIVTGHEWPGPPVSYLDLWIYPLHALFAAHAVYGGLLRRVTHPRWRTAVPALVMAATVLVPWTSLAVWVAPYEQPLLKNEIPFGWPPQRTPFVEFLQREIALRPDEPFRGRVANLAGDAFEPQYVHAPYINQHNYDGMVAFFVGNDHRQYGFWFYDVPTLDDRNHIGSPFLHLVISHLLNRPGVLFFRANETATRFEPKLLAQLGVRYVLTEKPLPGHRPVHELDISPERRQYLYELPNANVSGRGVTGVTVVRTAAEALVRLRSPDFDFEEEAVLFDRLPDAALGPVSRSRLDVHRGHLTVSAEAPGRALLILPVEYSRCLEFTWPGSEADPPRAFRANLDQTAVWFSHRLEGRLTLHHGPFVNPACRLRDLQDAVRVEVGRAR